MRQTYIFLQLYRARNGLQRINYLLIYDYLDLLELTLP